MAPAFATRLAEDVDGLRHRADGTGTPAVRYQMFEIAFVGDVAESTRTEGTSGAFNTLKPADFRGCLYIRTEFFISPIKDAQTV